MNSRTDLLALEELLEVMLLDNENISARSVTRRQESPFRHASDITRNPERTRLLDRYKLRQAELRALKEKTDKQSKTNLNHRIARLEEEKTAMLGQRDTLIASHRAMLLAVGEMGGMSAWKRFFSSWEETQEALRRMTATPTAGLHTLPMKKHPMSSEDV